MLPSKENSLIEGFILEEGLEVTETTYQSDTWEAPRTIVVRQQIKKRPTATGKQLKLLKKKAFTRITDTVVSLPIWSSLLI